MAADTLAQLPGQVVDGKYRVEGLLGRGGMGAVFRALHLGTGRSVALKVIAPAFAHQHECLTRFRREARACGQLRHPGARGLSAATASALLPLMPILSLAMLVLLIINAVIASLICARRATGESLERIFADFEISALPPDRVGMAAHGRLRERLVSQPMPRSTGTPQAPHYIEAAITAAADAAARRRA